MPIIAAVAATVTLFICFGNAGFIDDYAAIIALAAATVTNLSGMAATEVMMKDWNRRDRP